MKVELSLHDIANLMLACTSCSQAVSSENNKWIELHDRLENELKVGIMKLKGGC